MDTSGWEKMLCRRTTAMRTRSAPASSCWGLGPTDPRAQTPTYTQGPCGTWWLECSELPVHSQSTGENGFAHYPGHQNHPGEYARTALCSEPPKNKAVRARAKVCARHCCEDLTARSPKPPAHPVFELTSQTRKRRRQGN